MIRVNYYTAILFLLSLLINSCKEQENPCSLSPETLSDIHQLDSLVHIPALRQRDREWMNRNYKELSVTDAGTETYRLIRAGSLESTQIERIENTGGQYYLTKKIFSTPDDTIGTSRKFTISKKEWNTIVNGLGSLNFWTYPVSDQRNGLDGTSWILEGYKPTRDKCTGMHYHRIYRWSPNDTTFIAMCRLLYSLRK